MFNKIKGLIVVPLHPKGWSFHKTHLMKLPSHIGRNKANGFYLWDNQRGSSIGWLYLHNDGKDWCASYGTEGRFVCLNPDAEKPPYNNAVRYGKTPNEALQRLYDWCVENGFIKD